MSGHIYNLIFWSDSDPDLKLCQFDTILFRQSTYSYLCLDNISILRTYFIIFIVYLYFSKWGITKQKYSSIICTKTWVLWQHWYRNIWHDTRPITDWWTELWGCAASCDVNSWYVNVTFWQSNRINSDHVQYLILFVKICQWITFVHWKATCYQVTVIALPLPTTALQFIHSWITIIWRLWSL